MLAGLGLMIVFKTVKMTHLTSQNLVGYFSFRVTATFISGWLCCNRFFIEVQVRPASLALLESSVCVMTPRRHMTHQLKPQGDSTSSGGCVRVYVLSFRCVNKCWEFTTVTQWKFILHTHLSFTMMGSGTTGHLTFSLFYDLASHQTQHNIRPHLCLNDCFIACIVF